MPRPIWARLFFKGGYIMDRLTDARLITGYILKIRKGGKRVDWLLDCYPWGQPPGTACAVYDLIAGQELPPVPCAVIVELLTQHGLSEYDFEPPLELEKEDLQGRGVIV